MSFPKLVLNCPEVEALDTSTDPETDPFLPVLPYASASRDFGNCFTKILSWVWMGLESGDWEVAAGRGGTSRFKVAAAHPELPLVGGGRLSHSPLDIVHH